MGDLHDRLRDELWKDRPAVAADCRAPVECPAASRARHGGNRAHGRTAVSNPRRSSGAHLDRAERIYPGAGRDGESKILDEVVHASGAVAPVALPTTPRGCSRWARRGVGAGRVPGRQGAAAQLHQRHSATRQGSFATGCRCRGRLDRRNGSVEDIRLRFQPQWAWNPRIHEPRRLAASVSQNMSRLLRWLQFGHVSAHLTTSGD